MAASPQHEIDSSASLHGPGRPSDDAAAALQLVTMSRRVFLCAAAAAALSGCSATSRSSRLPGPTWRDRHDLPGPAEPTPMPSPSRETLAGGVIPRSRWALGEPVPTLMNRMLPVRHITVHHDGMTPFYAADESSSTARLESIRRAHRNRNWGDIGYHYAVDRAGRVYQCRPLTWQGAHVKDHNEGNIGVVNLGNFDLQSPSDAQVNALRTLLQSLRSQHGVQVARIRTHQEWAPTACPGRSMQRYMNTLRANGQLA